MTDKDIIKALEELLDKIRAYECNNASISKGLIENIINLIDRLQVKNKELDEKLIIQKGLIDTQKAEIERLKKERRLNLLTQLPIARKIKSEAIKEFAERLKERVYYIVVDEKGLLLERKVVNEEAIDNLVKEMTEECEK